MPSGILLKRPSDIPICLTMTSLRHQLALILIIISTCQSLVAGFAHQGRALCRVRTSCTQRHALRNPREQALQRITGTLTPLILTVIAPFAAAAAQKKYLTEPTADFKAEMARTAALEDTRAKLRAAWDALTARFEAAQTSSDLENVLIGMKDYLVSNGSVPPGYKKIELVKMCRQRKMLTPDNKRSKKTKPDWTTPVEIAYQALIQEFNKQLLPNNKPDMGSQ